MNERSVAGQASVAQQRQETQIVRTEGQSVATDVALAIADARDVDPVDIKPLGDVLDCEALENLVGSATTQISVSFTYEDLEVFVTNEGYIEVTPADAPVDAE